tara:strand:+ start:524 stop:982 length:459 start_codon:yes stop_codon:yes gene_type:complete
MSNILITSIGRRVALAKAFEIEIKKYFPNNRIFTADANPKVIDLNYLESLISFCKKNQIKLIIPTIDNELLFLAENKSHLLEHNITPIISSVEIIKKCRYKRLIHSFFKDHKIKVAEEYKLDNYRLPLYMKPIDGSRSEDNHIMEHSQYLWM